ncbi:MAG: adenine-specific methyltransferase EcoRI family protein [Kiritimatiellia bacterium]
MANKDLSAAKSRKKDEFYTQLSDIEKEMRYYKKHFQGKTVLCNCDDPYASNFFLHFFRKFSMYGLKKLVSVCYRNCVPDLFSRNADTHSIYLEYAGGADESRDPTKEEIARWVHPLKGDGNFGSDECIELLKQADIVTTNPPFSLFREYLAQLVEHDKRFLIIGNVNAITYKEVFPLIRDNKVWMGASIHSGDREFGVPRDYPLYAAGCRTDADGNKFIRVKGVRWFTNLDYKERHEELPLYAEYSPEKYPKYDNYDAINVDATADIPCDYDGVMGVPITFLDKYNPEQFEILGNEYSLNIDRGRGYVNGKRLYSRVFIRRINKEAK